jgi:putative transposase
MNRVDFMIPQTKHISWAQFRLPIESIFATVRHRTVRTKGTLSAKTAKLMVFKLVNAAAKTWRRLKGENQLPKVVQGVKFHNGIEVIELLAHHAAVINLVTQSPA